MIIKIVNLTVFYEGHIKVGHSVGKCLTLTRMSKLLARPSPKGSTKGKNNWDKQNWAIIKTKTMGNSEIKLFSKKTFESQCS